MAQVIGFSINIEGIKSIAQLNAEIKETKKAFEDAESALERAEISEKLGKLVAEQKAVKKAQDDVNKSFLETTGAIRPYDALSAKLNKLRKDYKDLAVTNQANTEEGKKLLSQVQELDKQLKNIDGSVGQYQRSVGDYSNKIQEAAGALDGFGGISGKIISGIQGIGAAFKTMLGPIGLVIAAFELIVGSVKAFFTSSEEGQNSLRQFGMVFNTIFKNIQDAVAVVGGVIIKGVEAIGGAIQYVSEALFGVNAELNKEIRLAQQLAKEQDAIDKTARKNLIKNAKDNQEIAELRNKVAQKDKFTNQERLGFLDQAIAKETEILKRNEDIAKRRLKVLKDETSVGQRTKEQKQAIAEAEAELINLQTENLNKTRELQGQRIEAINAEKAAAKTAADEQRKQNEEIQKERKKFQEDEAKFQQEAIKKNADIIQQTNKITTDLIANEYEKRRIIAQKSEEADIKALNDGLAEQKKVNQERIKERKREPNSRLKNWSKSRKTNSKKRKKCKLRPLRTKCHWRKRQRMLY